MPTHSSGRAAPERPQDTGSELWQAPAGCASGFIVLLDAALLVTSFTCRHGLDADQQDAADEALARVRLHAPAESSWLDPRTGAMVALGNVPPSWIARRLHDYAAPPCQHRPDGAPPPRRA